MNASAAKRKELEKVGKKRRRKLHIQYQSNLGGYFRKWHYIKNCSVENLLSTLLPSDLQSKMAPFAIVDNEISDCLTL